MQWLPLQKYPKDAAKSLIYNTSVASGRKKWRFGVELGWTVPRPTTAWEKTRVLSRFLATYATIFMKARKTVRNERLHTRQQSARAHT
jgi:hypothetical protein